MGYQITAYLINEDHLRRFAGQKDPTLVARIVGKREAPKVETFPSTLFAGMAVKVFDSDADPIDLNAISFAEEIAAGAPTLQGALEQLANGDRALREPSKYGFQYAYAVEVLCAFYGKKIMSTESPTLAADIRLSPAGLSATEELDAFLAHRPPIVYPEPQDFPVVGFWSFEQCAKRLHNVPETPQSPTFRAPSWWSKWPTDLSAERDQYVAWLRLAVASKTDLIGFYY